MILALARLRESIYSTPYLYLLPGALQYRTQGYSGYSDVVALPHTSHLISDVNTNYKPSWISQ